MPAKDKYSDPELRKKVKQDVQNSDKGGAPGQWSARRAQLMASEYKKRGGKYNTSPDQKDDSQKNLSNWSREDWQTKDGSGTAKQDDGSEKRYVPKKAWELMSEEEKATDDKKVQEGKTGDKQFVGNTKEAADATRKVSKDVDNEGEDDDEPEHQKDAEEGSADNDGVEQDANDQGQDGGEEDNKDEEEDQEYQQDEDQDEDEANANDAEEDDTDADGESQQSNKGKKRGRAAKSSQDKGDASKKQKSNGGNAQKKSPRADGQAKTVGSKHDPVDAPADKQTQVSPSDLPKVGQKASWKALPGWVDGEVVKLATEDGEVEGKSFKASEGHGVRIVLRSDKSGKICVHKPEGMYS